LFSAERVETISNLLKGENIMKSGTKDKVEGKLHEVKGKVKEIAGKLSDNPELEAECIGEKIAGKLQGKICQAKKAVGKQPERHSMLRRLLLLPTPVA
jgi:uncharacterized protein YjbJ (UPF0337 family)